MNARELKHTEKLQEWHRAARHPQIVDVLLLFIAISIFVRYYIHRLQKTGMPPIMVTPRFFSHRWECVRTSRV